MPLHTKFRLKINRKPGLETDISDSHKVQQRATTDL